MTTSLSSASGAAVPLDASVQLRRRGLRCTPGRLHALAMLSSSGAHLSSAEVFAQLRAVGIPVDRATVYRTLETLEAAGLVHAVHGRGPKRYGIGSEPHPHTVCEECGQVGDLTGERLGETVERIMEMSGLRPGASGSLLVYGLCARCAE
ncbi:Fur family transcriptional regulator [Streptomyces sp. NPDC014776]|uniref:Fur family transcriptional regulator n=1 Tax=unclassified Streptomyces TaxID=2593676 RepID=UPI0037013FDB